MKTNWNTAAMWLVVIGSLNVGLAALGYDILGMFGGTLGTVLDYLIGLSALAVGYNMLSGK